MSDRSAEGLADRLEEIDETLVYLNKLYRNLQQGGRVEVDSKDPLGELTEDINTVVDMKLRCITLYTAIDKLEDELEETNDSIAVVESFWMDEKDE